MKMFEVEVFENGDGDISIKQPWPMEEDNLVVISKEQAHILARAIITLAKK